MIIKYLKIKGDVLTNVNIKTADDPELPGIFVTDDLDLFKQYAIDTINWVIGQEVLNTVSKEFAKLSTANSKAIVLLAKLINTLGPDTTVLTETEKSIFDHLLTLADEGYSDSRLLKNTLKVVSENIARYTPLITEVNEAKSINSVISVLAKI